jgi:hypothetical protein
MAGIVNQKAAKAATQDLFMRGDTAAGWDLKAKLSDISYLSSLQRPLTGSEATELMSTERSIPSNLLNADYKDQTNRLTEPAKVVTFKQLDSETTVQKLALGYNTSANSAVPDNIHDTYRALGVWGRSDDDTKDSYEFVRSAVKALPTADPNAIGKTYSREDYWDLVNMKDDRNRYASETSRGFEQASTSNLLLHPYDDSTPAVLLGKGVDWVVGGINELLTKLLEGSPIVLAGGALLVLIVLKR